MKNQPEQLAPKSVFDQISELNEKREVELERFGEMRQIEARKEAAGDSKEARVYKAQAGYYGDRADAIQVVKSEVLGGHLHETLPTKPESVLTKIGERPNGKI